MIKVRDCQIRLETTVDGYACVCTWLGPKDNMWSPALKQVNREVPQEKEVVILRRAAEIFREKIQQLRAVLSE